MTAKDYQIRAPIRIFLSYFTAHRGLLAKNGAYARLYNTQNLGGGHG